MSPGDLGEFLKPFVFLDLFGFTPTAGHKGFGMHPHSGIATLTYMIEGDLGYEDTTGKKGVLPAGGVEWMRAGNGVWHTGAPASGAPRARLPALGGVAGLGRKRAGAKPLPRALAGAARRPGARAARALRRGEKRHPGAGRR